MSLLEKLKSGGSTYSNFNGVSPSIPNFKLSNLHDQYSTINDPTEENVRPRNGLLPQPTVLQPFGLSRDSAPTSAYDQPSE